MLSRVSLSVVTSLPDAAAAAADWSQAAASADSDEETAAAAAASAHRACANPNAQRDQRMRPYDTRKRARR